MLRKKNVDWRYKTESSGKKDTKLNHEEKTKNRMHVADKALTIGKW